MKEYKFKRGSKPEIDRIYECLTESFPVDVVRDGEKLAVSYGILSKLTVWIEDKKLVVDTVSDTDNLDDGVILDSNKRFRNFLLAATGYTGKERLKQAKKAVSE
jgi:hypothetical protein